MKLKFSGLVGVAALSSTQALADLNARLFVGRGSNGSDLGLPTTLPVDVCNKGAELPSKLPFETITATPLSLSAGIYRIEKKANASLTASHSRLKLDGIRGSVAVTCLSSLHFEPSNHVYKQDSDAG